jgi:hypothetical protein
VGAEGLVDFEEEKRSEVPSPTWMRVILLLPQMSKSTSLRRFVLLGLQVQWQVDFLRGIEGVPRVSGDVAPTISMSLTLLHFQCQTRLSRTLQRPEHVR